MAGADTDWLATKDLRGGAETPGFELEYPTKDVTKAPGPVAMPRSHADAARHTTTRKRQDPESSSSSRARGLAGNRGGVCSSVMVVWQGHLTF